MTDLFDLPFEDEPAPEPAPPAPAPAANAERKTANVQRQTTPSRRIFSVTELTVGIRDLLEDQFAEIWVEGELSGCRLWNTGHL